MEKDELLQIQKSILLRAEEEAKSENVPAAFVKAGDDMQFDLLEVKMFDLGMEKTECLGEFLFTGVDEEAGIQNFSGIYNLTDALNIEHLDQLYEAISLINFFIPYGCFGLYPSSGIIVYKLSAPLSVKFTEEELYDQIQILMTNGFLMVDRFIDVLIDIANGDKDVSFVYELLGAEQL